jgi:hypothetical protein
MSNSRINNSVESGRSVDLILGPRSILTIFDRQHCLPSLERALNIRYP